MTYKEFLVEIIEQGIEAVNIDYINDELKRKGAIAGFEACRNKAPEDLLHILHTAQADTQNAFRSNDPEYWLHRCFEAEVEWVCNVVSAILVNQRKEPLVSYFPTALGCLQAARILGYSDGKHALPPIELE